MDKERKIRISKKREKTEKEKPDIKKMFIHNIFGVPSSFFLLPSSFFLLPSSLLIQLAS